MNVLIIGLGQGSFEVRGRQLGQAIGARVATSPKAADLNWADLVVLIKRAAFQWVEHLNGKPFVWDALDFWQQPADNVMPSSMARHGFRAMCEMLRPVLVIGATEEMAIDGKGSYLPHHSRPGLTAKPIRDEVFVVAYEGTKKYLGKWAAAIDKECRQRGWKFVVNPSDLSTADLIVAFRDGIWDGWMCREWKSGVKLVNAMAVGRPVITQLSAAWNEIRPIGSAIEAPEDLAYAFNYWESASRRQTAVEQASHRQEFQLSAIARSYRQMLAAAL